MEWECSVYRWVLQWSAGQQEHGIRCLYFPRLFSQATLALKSTVLQLCSMMTLMLVNCPMNSFSRPALHQQLKELVLSARFIRTDLSVSCLVGHFLRQCVIYCCTFIASLSPVHSQCLWKGTLSACQLLIGTDYQTVLCSGNKIDRCLLSELESLWSR